MSKVQSSVLFVHVFVVFVYSLTLCATYYLLNLLEVNRFKKTIFAFICFMPNQILMHSVLLRECFQLFSIQIVLISLIHLCRDKKIFSFSSVMLIVGSIVFCALHYKFNFYIYSLCIVFIMMLLFNYHKKSFIKPIVVIVVNFFIVYNIFHHVYKLSSPLKHTSGIGLYKASSSYDQISLNVNTIDEKISNEEKKIKYKFQNDIDTWISNAKSIMSLYLSSQFGFSLISVFWQWCVQI